MFGGQFGSIEKKVVWGSPHIGWVKKLDQGKLILRKTPFADQPRSGPYVLPPDVDIPDRTFVELEVGHPRREGLKIDRATRILTWRSEWFPVEHWRPIPLPRPSPSLSPGEFKQRLIVNYKDGQADYLDQALAYQVLSCPPGLYGAGGIGSQSLSVSTGPTPLDHLRTTLRRTIPPDFFRPRSDHEFDILEQLSQAERLERRRLSGSVDEASYNYLKFVDPAKDVPPIQIPTILHNAEYRVISPYPDADVQEYIYDAWLVQPFVEESAITKMESYLKLIRDLVEPEYIGQHLPFDRLAIAKVAMAHARMEFRDRLDETALIRGRDAFLGLYKYFRDLKANIFRPGGPAWEQPQVNVSFAEARMGPHDAEVRVIIMRLVREQGEPWAGIVPIVEAARAEDITPGQVERSLRRLSDLGFVLVKDNMTRFRPFDLG